MNHPLCSFIQIGFFNISEIISVYILGKPCTSSNLFNDDTATSFTQKLLILLLGIRNSKPDCKLQNTCGKIYTWFILTAALILSLQLNSVFKYIAVTNLIFCNGFLTFRYRAVTSLITTSYIRLLVCCTEVHWSVICSTCLILCVLTRSLGAVGLHPNSYGIHVPPILCFID